MRTVSVIIPTYNRAHLVCDAIKSVLDQDEIDCSIEIIVVDDGSTDNTRQVVSSFDGNAKYIFQENQGPGVARNRGIDEASGDWIAFLDSDDLWLPDKLSLQFKVLESFPQYKAVHSNFYSTFNGRMLRQKGLEFWVYSTGYNKDIDWNNFYGKKYNSVEVGITRSGSSFGIYAGNIFGALVGNPCASCCTLLVQRDCLGEKIRFHARYTICEDYWFFCQLCECNDILFMDCPTAENRGHSGARLTNGREDGAQECRLEICSDIYLPSKSPFRPSDEVIYYQYRVAKTNLLKIYVNNGDILKARALIRRQNDICGFRVDLMYFFYRTVVWLPSNTVNRLLMFKRTVSRWFKQCRDALRNIILQF